MADSSGGLTVTPPCDWLKGKQTNDAKFLLHNLAKLVHIHHQTIGTTVAETKGLDNVTLLVFIARASGISTNKRLYPVIITPMFVFPSANRRAALP